MSNRTMPPMAPGRVALDGWPASVPAWRVGEAHAFQQPMFTLAQFAALAAADEALPGQPCFRMVDGVPHAYSTIDPDGNEVEWGAFPVPLSTHAAPDGGRLYDVADFGFDFGWDD